ncbi:uncharacterized protein LOC124937917 isoform X2 [Impatiens glandulifera]|uniref:uncharacterized protein LOC124937917 isoform X2 n=1 Tax=Impatiens glandulifera TaxID=253017 RepID=UPI001FB18E7E|nr:uncharacterized protein LOC124937917 isoform X2 [Impatiens glandulifera]
MEKQKNRRHVFPLTRLQFGDLQSYLSHLNLFLPPESKKIYILVDNRPWLRNLGLQSAHLWQFMVTKSRLSPFANTKTRKERKNRMKSTSSEPNPLQLPKRFRQLSSLIDAATLSRKKALLPVKKLKKSLISNSKLDRILYGFIVFEVAWSDVHGINYLNELQTDTALAIQSKFMRRWEFDSIAKAAKCISSWFSGTEQEQQLLLEHLESSLGEVFYDASEGFTRNGRGENDDESNCCENICYGAQSSHSSKVYPEFMETTLCTQTSPSQRRTSIKYVHPEISGGMYLEEPCDEPVHSPTSDCEDEVEAIHYKDVLILFRFNDPDLPFELRNIILCDLRLLTLLESGLPSWVIFFQSYPVFSHLYRPWMCPLARALYVFISVVTVLIGFYDLYKNIPVLKATASRLCGPLFNWIERWEMISRIKYLGTMLFLHNFEKAVKWVVLMSRATKSFISLFTKPMSGPLMEGFELLLPVSNAITDMIDGIFSVTCLIIGSAYNLMETLVETMLCPVWFTQSVVTNIVMFMIYPIFCILWEIVCAPIRLTIGLFSFMTSVCTIIYNSVGDASMFMSNMLSLASEAEATMTTYEASIWRSLWNDLFSKVFRSSRSILNGFVAFFSACNRHRHSIYNHVVKFTRRILRQINPLLDRNLISGRQNTLTFFAANDR